MQTEYSKILKYLTDENWSIENIDNDRIVATKETVQFVLITKSKYGQMYSKHEKALDLEYDVYINEILTNISKVSNLSLVALYDMILDEEKTEEVLSTEFNSFRIKVLNKIAGKLNKKYSHKLNCFSVYDFSNGDWKTFHTSKYLHNTVATLTIGYNIVLIDLVYNKIKLFSLFDGVVVDVDIERICLDNLVLIHDAL